MKLADLDIYKVGNTINLVGAVWAGEGKAFVCVLPGSAAEVRVVQETASGEHGAYLEFEDGMLPLETMNMGTDEWAKFIRQTDLMEVEILQTAKDGTVTKVIVRKSSRSVEPHVQWAVYRRDSYRCRYCGRDDAPMTVDHLMPHAYGGPYTEENLLCSCRKCNKMRGDMPYEEWLESGYYKNVSAFLPVPVLEANRTILGRLHLVERNPKVKSR